jgi:hypothetical protein
VTDRPQGEPFRIVPATPEPGEHGDLRPTAPLPRTPEPTQVHEVPPRVVRPVQHPTEHVVVDPPIVPPVAVPAYAEPPFTPVPPVRRDDRVPLWVLLAAVAGLALGGVFGFLIGRGSDDESAGPASTTEVTTLDDLLAPYADQAAQGELDVPTGNSTLDALVTAVKADPADQKAVADLTAQVEQLRNERDQQAAQVTTLQGQLQGAQVQLTAAQAERDQLKQQLEEAAGSSGTVQKQLDAANAKVTDLQKQLDTANADLATAQKNLTKAQSDLAAANDQLDALQLEPMPDYVGKQIAALRADAKSKGWTLIEQTVKSATASPGTVTNQAPAKGTNVIKGSVVVAEVAAAPGP